MDSFFRRLHACAMIASRKERKSVTVAVEDLWDALTEVEVMSRAGAAREMELSDARQRAVLMERKMFYLTARLDRELGKISGPQLFAILEDE